MSQRLKLLVVAIFVIVLTTSVTIPLVGKKEGEYKPGVLAEYDLALNQAKELYQQKKGLGYDFSSGPCLTNDLTQDWVADLVHVPRIDSDNLPQNQCQAYLEGRAKHFVELDLEGNLVRIR